MTLYQDRHLHRDCILPAERNAGLSLAPDHRRDARRNIAVCSSSDARHPSLQRRGGDARLFARRTRRTQGRKDTDTEPVQNRSDVLLPGRIFLGPVQADFIPATDGLSEVSFAAAGRPAVSPALAPAC